MNGSDTVIKLNGMLKAKRLGKIKNKIKMGLKFFLNINQRPEEWPAQLPAFNKYCTLPFGLPFS